MGYFNELDIERKEAQGRDEPWWDEEKRCWVGCERYWNSCSCVVCMEADVRNYKPLERRAILDSPVVTPLKGKEERMTGLIELRLGRLERKVFGMSFEEATSYLQKVEEALKRLSSKEAERYLKANERRIEMAESALWGLEGTKFPSGDDIDH